MKINTTPDVYCRQKVTSSGSSFYYSFLFLSPLQRQAIQAVYAFCREVDDIVDEYRDLNIAQIKLDWWHQEVDRLFLGQGLHPISQAIAMARAHYPLKADLFHEILYGMKMDLLHQGYATFQDLKRYCHRVAGCVGLLATEIFGYQDPQTLEYASQLGLAFQLVNIIRDVGEDASRARVYLPEEELHQFYLTPQDILNKQYSDNFRSLMQTQSDRARFCYQQAKALLPAVDRQKQRSGLIMAEIYFTLLDEIEKMDFQILNQRVSLTPLRKFWIAWKTARHYQKPRVGVV